jgi:hypothetical protein
VADADVIPAAAASSGASPHDRRWSRQELLLCLAAAALLVAARGALFMVPGLRFDADQGIVGLMAKHISEGRAFPLFFYGQSYLPAVEAYLAAPLMWILGPTEAALKLPVVAMNAAAVLLLIWMAHRDLGLRPLLAAAGALSLIVPPLVPGTRLMEAMGGNVEPLLYTMLLWLVRERRWTFGIVLAVAIVHREIVVYPVAALFVLEVIFGGWRVRATRERWAIAALLAAMASATVEAIRPHAPMFGPGTIARVADLDISGGEAVMTQICADPSRWRSRAELLATTHFPLMIGGLSGSVLPVGLSSGVSHGNSGLNLWVLVLMLAAATTAGLAAARRDPAAAANATRAVPGTALPWFLILTGLASTAVYWLIACSQITLNSLRYDLLVTLVPTGLLLAALCWPSRPLRAGLVTAIVLWCAVSVRDYGALAEEAWSGRWPDRRGELIEVLEARGIDTLWGEFRFAYILSFRSAERVVIAPTNIHRIDEYARRAAAANAPMLRTHPCPDGAGDEIVPGYWLCAPPRPEELPPVY